MNPHLFIGGVFALALTLPAQALVWDEGIDGDLSDNNLAPTPLTLDVGVNLIAGTMGKPPSLPLDRDIFTFTLPAGFSLTSIAVVSISPVHNSFYAIAAGTSINTGNAATHLSNALIGGPGEYLDDLAIAPQFGGTGLTSPVGPGTYTVWFQETAAQRNYQMAYTVVPEPGTIFSLLGGAAMLRHVRRRGDCRA